MTTPLNIIEVYAQDYSFTPGFLSILPSYTVADPSLLGYTQGWSQDYGIIDTVQNIPAKKYTSIQAVMDHYYATAAAFIVNEVNTNIGSTKYHLGDRLTVQNQYDALYDTKQPLATTLTDLSGITIAQDVLDMMADPSGAAGLASRVGTELALDSAAFHPDTYFATYTHTHVKADITDLGTVPTLPIAQSDVTGLVSALAGKAASSHTHAASDITSGTKTSAFISDFTEAAQDAVGSALSSEFVYDDTGNAIRLRSKTFNNPTRSLNSAFQISTTQDTAVSYSVDIACTLSLTGGQAGTVFLRYADDSAHTTNVKEVCRFAASNTGTLTIGLALNQIATGTVSGIIPAGKYAKMITNNDTGTPTFTYRNAQEVLL